MNNNRERYTIEIHDYVTNTGSVIMAEFEGDNADDLVGQAYGWLQLYDQGDWGYYPVVIKDHDEGKERMTYIEMYPEASMDKLTIEELAQAYIDKGYTSSLADSDEIFADINEQIAWAYEADEIGYWMAARDMINELITWIEYLEQGD